MRSNAEGVMLSERHSFFTFPLRVFENSIIFTMSLVSATYLCFSCHLVSFFHSWIIPFAVNFTVSILISM